MESGYFVKQERRIRILQGGAILLSLIIGSASADVFDMPPGQTSLSLVTVGNPGNPYDPETSGVFGGVGYNYNIGKFEITIGQYTEFLNAVADTDAHSLYSPFMATDLHIAGIARSGSPGSYSYSVMGSPNKPISNVNWGDAARFANWLTNGQPIGAQGPATTEDGSYFLNGATSQAALMAITRKPGAHYVIPSENEWYKAAYYDPTPGAGGVDNYWIYPMKTDNIPYSDQAPGADSPNAAFAGNFWQDDEVVNGYDDGFAVSASPILSPSQNYLTDVGAYSLASSFYGTYDQGGNLEEWNEATIATGRCLRGSSWDAGEAAMQSHYRVGLNPLAEIDFLGFRIAEVPEPATFIMLALASMEIIRRRRT